MAKTAIPNPHLGISRIDHVGSRTFGYFVRMGYRRTKRGSRPRFTAFFGDISHGGKRAALKAATTWRNKMLRALKVEEKLRAAQKPKRPRKRLARAA